MTNTARYNAVAKSLHWLIAFMIIVQIPAGLFMVSTDWNTFLLYQLHKSFGLIVLALSLFRLYWRLTHKAPPVPETMAGWEKAAAKFTHVAFYGLIIGIPLTGWLLVSASPIGIDTKIFFVIPVPHFPVPVGKEAQEFWSLSHEVLAKGAIALIVLHVGAALNHHIRLKDDVLRRMLPGFLDGIR